MNEISTLGVAGSDGVSPVYNPSATWKMWSIYEVWMGTGVGAGRYVPKVMDYVIDPLTYQTWIVRSIDPVTLIPELDVIRPANMVASFTETDILFGVGPGTQADTYRIYVDRSVMPYVMAVDSRLKVAGTMVKYAKIFRGSWLESEENVISKTYDASGTFMTNKVILENTDPFVQTAIKTVSVCHCTVDLPDGEVVTAVFYDDAGHVVSKRQLLVENTGFIRGVNTALKYITGIRIKSPFLSLSDNKTLEIPLNLPLNSLNIMGEVSYSNGEAMELPIDGVKFKLHGLDQYVSTIIGQKLDLVLSYSLSQTEAAIGVVRGENPFITEKYSMTTVDPNNSYSVKIYGYPEWMGEAVGYKMRWFLTNLDRNICLDITDKVRFAENTGAFDPKGYGYLQRKAISVRLSEVSGGFKPYTHTQLIDIVLKTPPNSNITPWQVSHEAIGERPMYGNGILAYREPLNHKQVKIGYWAKDKIEFIQRAYINTYPLVDRFAENAAPTPTHMQISYGLETIELSLDNWGKIVSFTNDIQLGSTLFLKWRKRLAGNILELGVSAMVVTQV